LKTKNKYFKVLFLLLICINFNARAQFATQPETSVSFDKIVLLDTYISEGASIGDIDGDGNLDVISGVLWWKGPEFNQSFSYAPVKIFPLTGPGLEGYSTTFFAFPSFIDDDKWMDILQIGAPSFDGYWIKNPGKNPFSDKNTHKNKEKFKAQEHICHESPQLINIIGDEKKELLAYSKGYITLGIVSDNTAGWESLAITHHDPNRFGVSIHSLGAGDVNNDGLIDVLEKSGWWEHPVNWNKTAPWTFHAYPFSPKQGGAQMYCYDIDGDGDNDVITSMNAHAYGLSWHEQIQENNEISFKAHTIMTDVPEGNKYGVSFSQLHALACVDIDNDGIKDIVTGKCYYAHNGRDIGAEDPAVLYWFKATRNKDGSVDYIPYLIDADSGVGRQISTGDLNKDGKMDIVVGNKKGVFAFIQN